MVDRKGLRTSYPNPAQIRPKLWVGQASKHPGSEVRQKCLKSPRERPVVGQPEIRKVPRAGLGLRQALAGYHFWPDVDLGGELGIRERQGTGRRANNRTGNSDPSFRRRDPFWLLSPKTSRRARSRRSEASLFVILPMMLPPTQELEPAAKPELFTCQSLASWQCPGRSTFIGQ